MKRVAPVSSHKVHGLYKRFGRAIQSRCRRLLRDPAEAEDATQEIFLRVLRHIESAPPEDATLAWIYRISTNYCLNVIRNGRNKPEAVEDVPEQSVDSFEGSVISRDFTERLMRTTEPELKIPVMLYHVKGMDQSRIAETLGVSRRTVLYRLGAFSERARPLASECDSDFEP